MRIAVDVRPLSVPITGIGQYTRQLLFELIVTSPADWHWYLYSDKPLLAVLGETENVTVRVGRFSSRFLSTVFAQIVFPIWSLRDKIDWFWSPRHHLPVWFPCKLRKLVSIHDMVWKKYPETMLGLNLFLERILMPLSLRSADLVISVSRSTATDLIQEYPSVEEKLSIISNAATAYPIATPAGGVEPFFLFVGTLEPRKNLMALLNAFKLLVDAGTTGYKLVIVGGQGWGDQELSSTVKGLALEPYVEIRGYVAVEKLHHLYQQAFALVMPSLYEGFGIPLLEAMQYGTPVITSNCASMPEVAGGGGLLVDPESAGEICAAMQTLITEPQLRQTLSESGIEQASRYSWKKSALTLIKLLNNDARPD